MHCPIRPIFLILPIHTRHGAIVYFRQNWVVFWGRSQSDPKLWKTVPTDPPADSNPTNYVLRTSSNLLQLQYSRHVIEPRGFFCIIQALQDAADDTVGPTLTALETDESELAIFSSTQDNRQRRLERKWIKVSNAQSWFFEYALRQEFRNLVS